MRTLLLTSLLGLAALSSAVSVWNEGVQGDLSGNHLSPTVLTVSAGSNLISGVTEDGDVDYFRISLAPGQAITGLRLESYNSTDPFGFIGFQAGTQFSDDANNVAATDLLGWTLFGDTNVGTDILPGMATNFGAQGFTVPLTGPNYVFWVQQLGPPTSYTFNVQVVPEPGTMALALGVAGLLARRRRAKA